MCGRSRFGLKLPTRTRRRLSWLSSANLTANGFALFAISLSENADPDVGYWDSPKMINDQIEHAQRELVHRHLSWRRVKFRLGLYPAIARTIPFNTMWQHRDQPPYYCHYMAWRLGSYNDESPFKRLEMMLRCAESLPNWEHEIKSFVHSTDFASYWSLVWQLQVAKHLCEVGTEVAWLKNRDNPAPDFVANVGGKEWYVECYAVRKSFALYLLIEELLQRLDPELCVSYDRCLLFGLFRSAT